MIRSYCLMGHNRLAASILPAHNLLRLKETALGGVDSAPLLPSISFHVCSLALLPMRDLTFARSLTEVGQLELPNFADEQVLGLDVAVQDPPPVAVGQAAEQLEEKELGILRVEAARVLLQVLRQVRVLKQRRKGSLIAERMRSPAAGQILSRRKLAMKLRVGRTDADAAHIQTISLYARSWDICSELGRMGCFLFAAGAVATFPLRNERASERSASERAHVKKAGNYSRGEADWGMCRSVGQEFEWAEQDLFDRGKTL